MAEETITYDLPGGGKAWIKKDELERTKLYLEFKQSVRELRMYFGYSEQDAKNGAGTVMLQAGKISLTDFIAWTQEPEPDPKALWRFIILRGTMMHMDPTGSLYPMIDHGTSADEATDHIKNYENGEWRYATSFDF